MEEETQDSIGQSIDAVAAATKRIREENVALREQLANASADVADTKAILDKYAELIQLLKDLDAGDVKNFMVTIYAPQKMAEIATLITWYEKHLHDPRMTDKSWHQKAKVVVEDAIHFSLTLQRGLFASLAKSGEFINRRD